MAIIRVPPASAPLPGLPPLLVRVALRLVVAVVCVAAVVAVAQLTIHGLLAYYVDIAPYTGSG